MEAEKGQLKKNVLTMQAGAVTFLDVLGWKGIWQRKPDAMEALKSIGALMADLQKIEVSQWEEYAGLSPKILVLSDTIILTTHGKPKPVLSLHIRMTKMLLSYGLTDGLPVRGAIGYGPFASMDNIFVGPAVDEVASWYEAVEWVGAILTPNASFYYQGESYPKGSVLEYNVPIMRVGRYAMKCVGWLSAIKDEKELLQKFRATGSIVTPDVAPKYLNTVEFFRYIQELKKTGRAEGE